MAEDATVSVLVGVDDLVKHPSLIHPEQGPEVVHNPNNVRVEGVLPPFGIIRRVDGHVGHDQSFRVVDELSAFANGD